MLQLFLLQTQKKRYRKRILFQKPVNTEISQVLSFFINNLRSRTESLAENSSSFRGYAKNVKKVVPIKNETNAALRGCSNVSPNLIFIPDWTTSPAPDAADTKAANTILGSMNPILKCATEKIAFF